MTHKDWIANKLIEEGMDERRVRKQYDSYVNETESTSSYRNFSDYVLRVKKQIQEGSLDPGDDIFPSRENESEALRKEILQKGITREYLTNLLDEYVRSEKRRVDYSDLKTIAENNNFTVSVFSKVIPDLKQVVNDIYKANLLSFETEVSEEKLKRKISVLESELKGLREKHTDYSMLIDTLDEVVVRYQPWETPNFIIPTEKGNRHTVALFSDLHSGEIVASEEMHGIADYNQTIMQQRIDQYFNEVIEYSKELGSNVLHLKMLGDMINGEIHDELLRNSDLDTVESLILVADYTSKWIRRLSEFYKEIHVYCISGNHGRFSKKPIFKKKNSLNFDYLAYEFIRREVSDIVTSFDLPKSSFIIRDILGYTFLSLHGDVFSGGSGISAVSNTMGRDVEKINGIFKKTQPFDFVEIGHFHKAVLDIPTFSGISIIQNGSIKGPDQFSINAVKSGGQASQVVYMVEENKGVRFRTAIMLD